MSPQIAEELRNAVRDAARALRRLADTVVSMRPAPDRWTIKEVVGHLIDSAANNHQRFVRARCEAQLAFPAYEQNEWVCAQSYNDADWHALIDLWSAYNEHLAHVISNVSQDTLRVQCTIGDCQPVTLQFLMEDYLAHLKHHLRTIAKRLDVDPLQFAS